MGDTLRDIVDGIRAQPGRFTMSALALAIGMIALALLIAVLTALQDRADNLLQDLGVNVIGILGENDGRDSRDGPGLLHARRLAENYPQLGVTTIRRYQAPTIGPRQARITVVATDEYLQQVRQWRLLEGRFLDHNDVHNRQRHAVISKRVSERWRWPLGAVVYVRETPFKVVGIVDVGGRALQQDYGDTRLVLGENVVLVPNTVTPYWVRDAEIPGHGVDAIFVRDAHTDSLQRTVQSLRGFLDQPGQRIKNVSWVTPDSLLARINQLQSTIGLTVGTVAILCLVLGGTTLMSLMVANVRDRVTEIGLRAALGATHWDIAGLFVAEAVIVTLLAGIIGTAVAHGMLFVFREVFPVPVQAGWLSVLLPTAIALLLGIASAYWPARMAARVTPSEALRDE